MAKVKVLHDLKGETLTVYFGEPSKDQICEEVGGGVILIKNKFNNEIIGFEKLYFNPPHQGELIIDSRIIES